jgi:hypothetical protein
MGKWFFTKDGPAQRARRVLVPLVTWRCHVCDKEREDDKINVYQLKQDMHPGALTVNVRYCNDNPRCKAGAVGVANIWLEAGKPVGQPGDQL